MQKIKIAVIAALSLIIVWQITTFIGKRSNQGSQETGTVKSDDKTLSQLNKKPPVAGLEAQTNAEGPVSVEVTPKDISSDKWKFEIILNTHSVELDYDLTKSAVLMDASGKEYKPLSWEGDPPEGHHREGFLIFEAIRPKPASLTLKIKEIGGIEERNFAWKLSFDTP